MLCYVRLFLNQWLPRLITADFRYCSAPTESTEVATPLQVCRGYTRRVCFHPPTSGSVRTDLAPVHSSLAIPLHSRVLGLSCCSDYLSFKWSCVYMRVHVCRVCVCVCVCYIVVFVCCAYDALLPSPAAFPLQTG